MATIQNVSGNLGQIKAFSAVAVGESFDAGGDKYCKVDDARGFRYSNGQLVSVSPEDQCTVFNAGTVATVTSFVTAADIAQGEAYESGGDLYLVGDACVLKITNIASPQILFERPDNGDVRPASSITVTFDQ